MNSNTTLQPGMFCKFLLEYNHGKIWVIRFITEKITIINSVLYRLFSLKTSLFRQSHRHELVFLIFMLHILLPKN